VATDPLAPEIERQEARAILASTTAACFSRLATHEITIWLDLERKLRGEPAPGDPYEKADLARSADLYA
jgi:hypothetical protein